MNARALILASGEFLTGHFPDNVETWTNDQVLNYVSDNAAQTFEGFEPQELLDAIKSVASLMEKYAAEQHDSTAPAITTDNSDILDIEFEACINSTVYQRIKIIDPSYTADDIVNGLNSGDLMTTLFFDSENVAQHAITSTSQTTVALVISTDLGDGETDYTEFAISE